MFALSKDRARALMMKEAMIPLSSPAGQPPDWRQQLAEALRTPGDLLAFLDLPPNLAGDCAHQAFALKVPRYYAGLMQPGDPRDPLLRQVLPQAEECRPAPGFSADPTGDRAADRGAGVLHKYQGRALVVTTGACAVHCRYCFRRHFPYGEAGARGDWQAVLDTLAAEPGVSEVILSGGDPLVLDNQRLADLIEPLSCLPKVRRLRIHTRTPVVLPDRLDEGLVEILAGCSLPLVMVLHANHPHEITDHLARRLWPLRRAGITLLNQAVLLAGVNDSGDTLAALSERLHDCGVLPYYLHQLDRVQGAAHFEVNDQRARALHLALAARLPGYLVPRLVREIPGEAGKQPL